MASVLEKSSSHGEKDASTKLPGSPTVSSLRQVVSHPASLLWKFVAKMMTKDDAENESVIAVARYGLTTF